MIGVPLTGYLLEKTDNWEVSMFLPAIFFYVTVGALNPAWNSVLLLSPQFTHPRL